MRFCEEYVPSGQIAAHPLFTQDSQGTFLHGHVNQPSTVTKQETYYAPVAAQLQASTFRTGEAGSTSPSTLYAAGRVTVGMEVDVRATGAGGHYLETTNWKK